jgi:serine/threonine protein kinase
MAEPLWAFEADDGSHSFAVDVADPGALLGGGAYGAVYAATLHGRQVAAKTLHMLKDPAMYGLVGRDAEPGALNSVLAMFETEVMALAAVDHPNILRFIGVGYSAATAALPRLPKWIVTEIMPHSLHSYLRQPGVGDAMSMWDVACVGMDLADGLAYLHGRGIIHRDLKPKNVLLGPSGAKLGDLGTAKMIGAAAATAQHTVGPGTAIYHPPEVLTGDYTAAIDVFGLGLCESGVGRLLSPWQ